MSIDEPTAKKMDIDRISSQDISWVTDSGFGDGILKALIPQDYGDGVSHEWLVASGTGGYASSTTVGANTRSYHGLLVAALRPPVDRLLLLSSLDESVNGRELACHKYPGVIHPQGNSLLQLFRLDPFPTFQYRAGDVDLVKRIFMVHGEDTTFVQYRISGDCDLEIVPLVTSRSFHTAGGRQAISQHQVPGGTEICGKGDMFLLSDLAGYVAEEVWYNNFEYEVERERGLAWREDLLSPGRFRLNVKDEASFCIMASTVRRSPGGWQDLLAAEIKRLAELQKHASSLIDGTAMRFVQAADSFIVPRDGGRSIIAGYHWFDDWGRDAMISIPGLLLSTGRFGDARAVLLTFAGHIRDGILPNDLGAGSYNTADASLWFVRAVGEYLAKTGDLAFVEKIWTALIQVIKCYSGDTPVSRMDSDGLIVSGPGMTWMDARVDGRCVTPRAGKAVEINALWYAALRSVEQIRSASDKLQTDGLPFDLDELAIKVKKSFRRFWNIRKGYLYDVIDPIDPTVRPNQVIAAAFSADLLSKERRMMVVATVQRELLTPYGLRTLAPAEDGYIGRYEGSPRDRDRAYHQGTVWPWLIGPFVTAYLLAYPSRRGALQAREMLLPLINQDYGGLLTVAEVYDGDAPHRPGGCISQAWSVGELIRAWRETGIALGLTMR